MTTFHHSETACIHISNSQFQSDKIECERVASTHMILTCALKLSIHEKGAQCYLRTKSALTFLGGADSIQFVIMITCKMKDSLSIFVRIEKTVTEMVTGCLRMIKSNYSFMQITKIGF